MASYSTPKNMEQIEAAMAKLSRFVRPEDRRQLFTKYSVNISASLIDNAIASPPPSPQSLQVFELFPKLPTEIRLKIWRLALESSRIIELLRKPNIPLANFPYKQAVAPSLLLVNRESKAETLSVYKRYISNKPFKWIRFEQDIFHAKDLSLFNLCDVFENPTHNLQISRWASRKPNPAFLLGSNKWINRPDGFDKIRALAISRDVLVHLNDDYEAVIRHFFPNLLVLIVLIDDETNIEDTWGVWDVQYAKYEELWKGEVPRLEFAKKCSGPFKEVKINQDYQMGVEYEMRKHFSREEKDHPWYVAPRIKVMGALLHEGADIAECGRLPAIPAEKKKDPFADPFAGFGDVQSGWLRSRRSSGQN